MLSDLLQATQEAGKLAFGDGIWHRLQVSVTTLWASCFPRLVIVRSLREEAPRWGPWMESCTQRVLSPGVWLFYGRAGLGSHSEVSEVGLDWMTIL